MQLWEITGAQVIMFLIKRKSVKKASFHIFEIVAKYKTG